HIIAAKAVAFGEAMKPEFVTYQKAVVHNCQTLAQELQHQGFRLVSGGTDNHLLLLDLTNTGITGRVAATALDAVGITANKNAIPFDTRPPTETSGLRLGTAAVTSRGFGPEEMKRIARLIALALAHLGNERVYQEVQSEVEEMCYQFPVPGLP
ncbi:MAG: serine hydroxymethyltransferase, partial [Chloroflexi bacterium]|nr:serine hydroxymethyltransferase [Chloroflexota bacterium]